jgi:hypothetical protein
MNCSTFLSYFLLTYYSTCSGSVLVLDLTRRSSSQLETPISIRIFIRSTTTASRQQQRNNNNARHELSRPRAEIGAVPFQTIATCSPIAEWRRRHGPLQSSAAAPGAPFVADTPRRPNTLVHASVCPGRHVGLALPATCDRGKGHFSRRDQLPKTHQVTTLDRT